MTFPVSFIRQGQACCRACLGCRTNFPGNPTKYGKTTIPDKISQVKSPVKGISDSLCRLPRPRGDLVCRDGRRFSHAMFSRPAHSARPAPLPADGIRHVKKLWNQTWQE
ncbi:unnamed protein product [Ciceribacter sp. T2.26MG-112.2]|nr:unnamed protein product [Ciceribacter naphthalenivorans]